MVSDGLGLCVCLGIVIIFVQRVTDFAQQQNFFARLCWCFFSRSFGFFHRVDGFNHAEDGSGDDQEADHSVDEQTDVQVTAPAA